MARYRVLTWRGIPAQIKVTGDDGKRVSRPFADWFQQEIDRVAMREGLSGSDAYFDEWTWSDEEIRLGTAADVAAAVIGEIEASWPRRR